MCGKDVADFLGEKILSEPPQRRVFEEEKWKSEVHRIYSSSADEVIALQKKIGWYWEDNNEKVLPKWNAIREVLAEAPTQEHMLQMIEAVGMDYQGFMDFYGQEKINDGLFMQKT